MTELTGWRRPLVLGLTIAYLVFVAVICFMPQPQLVDGIETPGIQYFGRLVVLLRPFNTLWALGDIRSLKQLLWVLVQNLMNIFLLYPAGLGVIWLSPRYRSMAAAAKLGFLTSLAIESTQLLLDLLFASNRVFEIDDLWTNTLGVVLAYATYVYWRKVQQ